MALVLTSCTNRKRVPAPSALRAHEVGVGALEDVVGEWVRRLDRAGPAATASGLYCGRAFRQAESAALRLNAGLLIVSAGLGLVAAASKVPSYSLTIVPLVQAQPVAYGCVMRRETALQVHLLRDPQLRLVRPPCNALACPYPRPRTRPPASRQPQH